ncbi:hypothetical protein ABPG75_004952 [Micractinium tetrahymenae]
MSRRALLQRMLSLGEKVAVAGTTTSVVGSLVSHDEHEHFDFDSIPAGAAARQQQHAAQPASAVAARMTMSTAPAPRRQSAISARPSTSTAAAAARPAAAAASPRVLELQSAAELQHLLASHKGRVLVVHLAAAGCPIGEAFLPCLYDACRRYRDALFMRLTLQPAAEAAAPAESQELVEGLHIGRLPCLLLLRGDQLLARLEVGAEQPPAAAAPLAAVTLHEAVAAALRPAAPSDEQPARSAAPSFAVAA